MKMWRVAMNDRKKHALNIPTTCFKQRIKQNIVLMTTIIIDLIQLGSWIFYTLNYGQQGISLSFVRSQSELL